MDFKEVWFKTVTEELKDHGDKLKNIHLELQRMNEEHTRMNDSLDHHIKRTELLENRQADFEDKMAEVFSEKTAKEAVEEYKAKRKEEERQKFARNMKILAAVATIISIVTGILALTGNL